MFTVGELWDLPVPFLKTSTSTPVDTTRGVWCSQLVDWKIEYGAPTVSTDVSRFLHSSSQIFPHPYHLNRRYPQSVSFTPGPGR